LEVIVPQGQKRSGNVIGTAIIVAKIATGEIEDALPSNRRNGGLKDGKARADKLTAEQRN
jgi:hypothetical protein